MQLTFKTKLACKKPYNSLPGDQYLALLQKNETAIYEGSFGVYNLISFSIFCIEGHVTMIKGFNPAVGDGHPEGIPGNISRANLLISHNCTPL